MSLGPSSLDSELKSCKTPMPRCLKGYQNKNPVRLRRKHETLHATRLFNRRCLVHFMGQQAMVCPGEKGEYPQKCCFRFPLASALRRNRHPCSTMVHPCLRSQRKPWGLDNRSRRVDGELFSWTLSKLSHTHTHINKYIQITLLTLDVQGGLQRSKNSHPLSQFLLEENLLSVVLRPKQNGESCRPMQNQKGTYHFTGLFPDPC